MITSKLIGSLVPIRLPFDQPP